MTQCLRKVGIEALAGLVKFLHVYVYVSTYVYMSE